MSFSAFFMVEASNSSKGILADLHKSEKELAKISQKCVHLS